MRIPLNLLATGVGLHASIKSKMIMWTAGIAAILGAVVTLTWLEPPTGIPRVQTPSGPSPRGPASVRSALSTFSLDEANRHKAASLDLPCRPAGPEAAAPALALTLESGVRQLRLNGVACSPEDKPESTAVVNVSNGFSATVFPTGDGRYTTDYISLDEGENHLRIDYETKSGRRETHVLRIDRAPAAQKE